MRDSEPSGADCLHLGKGPGPPPPPPPPPPCRIARTIRKTGKTERLTATRLSMRVEGGIQNVAGPSRRCAVRAAGNFEFRAGLGLSARPHAVRSKCAHKSAR